MMIIFINTTVTTYITISEILHTVAKATITCM